MLIGKRLKLCAIEESHLGTLAQWRSDPAVYDFFHEYAPISVPAQREWFDAHRREPSEINFASVLHDGTLLGTISLVDLDLRNRNAELGRVLIGVAEQRGKGYGHEMVTLAIEYAFDHLNLHKLVCEVLATNELACGLYRRLGFVDEGVLRQQVYKRGDYWDVQILALFRENYSREA
jgi:diamine N-acetyltransferase